MSWPNFIFTVVISGMAGSILANFRRRDREEQARTIRILDRVDDAVARLAIPIPKDDSLTPASKDALRSKGSIEAGKCLRREMGLSLKDAVERVQHALGPGLERKIDLLLNKLTP